MNTLLDTITMTNGTVFAMNIRMLIQSRNVFTIYWQKSTDGLLLSNCVNTQTTKIRVYINLNMLENVSPILCYSQETLQKSYLNKTSESIFWTITILEPLNRSMIPKEVSSNQLSITLLGVSFKKFFQVRYFIKLCRSLTRQHFYKIYLQRLLSLYREIYMNNPCQIILMEISMTIVQMTRRIIFYHVSRWESIKQLS